MLYYYLCSGDVPDFISETADRVDVAGYIFSKDKFTSRYIGREKEREFMREKRRGVRLGNRVCDIISRA